MNFTTGWNKWAKKESDKFDLLNNTIIVLSSKISQILLLYNGKCHSLSSIKNLRLFLLSLLRNVENLSFMHIKSKLILMGHCIFCLRGGLHYGGERNLWIQ